MMPGEHELFVPGSLGGLNWVWPLSGVRAVAQREGQLRPGAHLSLQLFARNVDDGAPTVRTFGRMVQAQHVRVWPHISHRDANHSISPRVELLGCAPGTGGLAVGRCRGRGRREPSAMPSHQCPHWRRLRAQEVGAAVRVLSVPRGGSRATG